MNKMVLLARLCAVLIFAFALFALKASAAPQHDGDMDTSFAGGTVRTDFALAEGGIGTAVALQPDGKLLVAGATINGSGGLDAIAVARYNPDGSLDPEFGGVGTVRVRLTGLGSAARAMVLQADGKIILAGNIGTSAALVRLTSNGTLDNSFADDGLLTVVTNADYQVFNALALQPDGKIVTVGQREGSGCVGSALSSFSSARYEDIIVARFNLDGSADSTFGENGVKIILAAQGDDLEGANAVAIASDGAIVVAGYRTSSDCNPDFFRVNENFLALRLQGDQLDTSFGTDGFVLTPLESTSSLVHTLLLQDDKIVLGGGNAGDFVLARYNHNGTLDPSFGLNGTMTTDFNGGEDFITALALQADGKIVAAGSATVRSGDFGIARYSVDGAIDDSFGLHGKAIADFGGTYDLPGAIMLNSATGSLFVAGRANVRFAVTQFGSDGRTNLKFGTYGQVTTQFLNNDSTDAAHALARQDDGKIVVAGTVRGPNSLDFALIRYNTDGTLDSTFGVGGKVLSDFGGDEIAYAVAMLSDGRIVVGGAIGGRFGLAFYNADGTTGISTEFSGGYLVTHFSDSGNEAVYSLIVSNFTILAYGAAGDGSLALARYNPVGALDQSFGVGGKVSINQYRFQVGRGMLLQSDGKILLTLSDYYGLGVVRLLHDGSMDQSFGDGGLAYKRLSKPSAFAVAIQPSGKIVVGGSSTYQDYCIASVPNRPDPSCIVFHQHYVLLRFTADGFWDESFGNAGLELEPANDVYDSGVRALLAQSDGHIIAALSRGNKFVIYRYSSDGIIDSTFGDNGHVTLWNGNGDNWPGLLQQPDGKLLFTGPDTGEGVAGDFALVRLTTRPSFSDVTSNDYFYEPLLALTERFVLSGYSDGSFRPYNNTTRLQLAKIVVIANNLPLVTHYEQTFDDVPVYDPFYNIIETVATRGIISGYTGSGPLGREFRPGVAVTRAQLSKIVVGAAGWTLVDPANATFSDVPHDDTFYRYVETAAAHGIISGYQTAAGLEFRPGNPATRGQIAKIVYLATASGAAQK